jgi:murein DD-endopeptidase MepM/ murein hydrolase activator NlpD
VEHSTVPEACTTAWGRLATRAVAVVCALGLLVGAAPASPSQVAASDLSGQISSGRRSQAYFESVMLAQDAVIARIKSQSKATQRAFKHAKRSVAQRKHALWEARGVVAERARRLAELEAQHAQTPVEQIPPDWSARVKELRGELATATSRRVAIGKALRTSIRQRQARQHRLGALKRQRRGAVARRESAEAGLGAYIVEMTRLAQERAENQSSMRLSTVTGFTWPSVGRISQTYGCTGFRLNPRRGSCAHFHDGLDIVAPYGSRIASAADGVVAYAGWNPWDEGGRAWLMVVSHPDGYVTRYGHLVPSEIARVGEFVRQGQAIGRMGNTGRSTGTHLHFELLRGGDDVDPSAYLPEGMVTVKVAKPSRDRDRARQGSARKGADGGRAADRPKGGTPAGRTGEPSGADDRGRDSRARHAGSNDGRSRDARIQDADAPGASDDVERDVFALSWSADPGSVATTVVDVSGTPLATSRQPDGRRDMVAAGPRAAADPARRPADVLPVDAKADAADARTCPGLSPDDGLPGWPAGGGGAATPGHDGDAVAACVSLPGVGLADMPGRAPEDGFQGVPKPERGSSPVPS